MKKRIEDYQILQAISMDRIVRDGRSYVGATKITFPKSCWVQMGMPEVLSLRISQQQDLVLFTLITGEVDECVRRVHVTDRTSRRCCLNLPTPLRLRVVRGYYPTEVQDFNGHPILVIQQALKQ